MDKCNQVHYHVCGQTERSSYSEKDPKHEFVGARDSVTLGVDENHDHLVEEHLDITDGDEGKVPACKDHKRDHKHGQVGHPENSLVHHLRLLSSHQKGRQKEQKSIHRRGKGHKRTILFVSLHDWTHSQSFQHSEDTLVLVVLVVEDHDDRCKDRCDQTQVSDQERQQE